MGNKKTRLSVICYRLSAVIAGFMLIAAAGCEEASSGGFSAGEQIQKLREEKTQLQGQIEQAKSENEQLKARIQILTELPADVRLENIYNLQKIKLTRYTGLYDKNGDGKKEKLIVYIQPIDEEDDIVKATGAVDVQLWDLNKESEEALLGQWRVEAEELKKMWFATVITINYRLTFDLPEGADNLQEDLTVKVTFTDYLSGKVFKKQRVIRPG